MIARRTLLAALAGFALAPVRAQNFGNVMVPVRGQLVSHDRGPVPGVTVSLVHSVLGRSAPALTDGSGRFGWNAIPVRPEPYYLEMYWGQRLIYRNWLLVNGPLQMQPIVL